MAITTQSTNQKPGYKQSEIGMIPVEWNTYKFEQIATIRKKRSDPKRNGRHSFCIELEHIGQGSGQLIGYSSTTVQSSLKAQFNTGDILFGRLRAYLRKYWLADRDGVCSTEIWPLVPNSDVVSGQYLFQLVQTNRFIEAASSAYGTHMPRTDWNVIKIYVISLPPLMSN
jgi:type I restriction enzyme, S subunit